MTLGKSERRGSMVVFTTKLPETDNYKIMLLDKHNIPLMDVADDIAAIK